MRLRSSEPLGLTDSIGDVGFFGVMIWGVMVYTPAFFPIDRSLAIPRRRRQQLAKGAQTERSR